ncbi:UPF0280 family protein [Defluviimonas sp. WL0075]|uniref:UPF0280 family protein n=1 Tax=Albidovulum sediminicola TaxID=2984331 RepID=A0ABT2Z3F0_9RHOB|nr:UPF0280 family protein [Defluviimonas sp. WL0075]MCV2865617.1 UPF0280 family protein [Defluviimonas sp. WL0075]
MPATAARLPGNRLHLQHGPIDLILGADGPGREAAFAAATRRFAPLLDELVAELPLLRQPPGATRPSGPVARRMDAAVRPHSGRHFITPMAAVAGAVADEVLAAMVAAGDLSRAYVNDGGDIALHLESGQVYRAGMAGLDTEALGAVDIRADSGIRGIATSGRGGRSLSLGIADSVTALAATAAAADAAATLIANAVNLTDHPAITRRPARALDPDSDLGDRPVTVAVGTLSAAEIATALDRGLAEAAAMQAAGLIAGAALFLNRASRVLAPTPETEALAHA